MIQSSLGHCVLFAETRYSQKTCVMQWHFTLQCLDGSEHLEVTEPEPGVEGERLELLATVRGLEAIDKPSRVILLTPSRYVGRGLRNGLKSWRDCNWLWERFGQLVDIKDADLWQRVDRALMFHEVDCPQLGNIRIRRPGRIRGAAQAQPYYQFEACRGLPASHWTIWPSE